MVKTDRAGRGSRRILGLMLVAAAVVGGAASAVAEERAGAPIIYAKPATRFENRAPAPVVQAAAAVAAPMTFNQFEGRSAPLPAAAAPDTRPAAEAVAFAAPAPAYIAPVAPTATRGAPPFAGAPYEIAGKWYVPMYEPDYDEVGVASWYGPNFHGKLSATGETYDQEALTAAHPTLPIPSMVRVTNLENGKSIIVKLNDRGPFVDDRIIDMSKGAARALDMIGKGTAKVRVQYVGPADGAEPVPAATPILYQQTAMPVQPVVQPAALSTASAPLPVAGPMTAATPSFVAEPAPLAVPARAPAGRGQGAVAAELHGFYLQAGSFADLDNAQKLRDRMPAGAFVTQADVNGTMYYRVMLGPWSNRAEAEAAQARTDAKTIVVAKN